MVGVRESRTDEEGGHRDVVGSQRRRDHGEREQEKLGDYGAVLRVVSGSYRGW